MPLLGDCRVPASSENLSVGSNQLRNTRELGSDQENRSVRRYPAVADQSVGTLISWESVQWELPLNSWGPISWEIEEYLPNDGYLLTDRYPD